MDSLRGMSKGSGGGTSRLWIYGDNQIQRQLSTGPPLSVEHSLAPTCPTQSLY